MSDPKPIRVVHYPGRPDEVGVLIPLERPEHHRRDGPCAPTHVICWSDGYDGYVERGWLLEAYKGQWIRTERLVPVSRSQPLCRRLLDGAARAAAGLTTP